MSWTFAAGQIQIEFIRINFLNGTSVELLMSYSMRL